MKVSIKQIAEMTGFSPATVSNALNHKKGVNAQTAESILQAASQLGYFEEGSLRKEGSVRKVKFVTYKRNGVIVEDTPFFPLMITGAEQECSACGMELVLYNLDRRDPDFAERLKAIQTDPSAAVILLGTELLDEDIGLIQGISGTFVVIDYWKEDTYFDAVLINNADSARMATNYLIGKGHQKIGYIQGNFRIKPFRSRASGYHTAMNKAHLPINQDFIFTVSTTTGGAYRDMKEYLQRGASLPTAFVADNDIIALGAMKAFSEFGIRIPEDVSIIGFDDLSYSSIANPPLTTLRVPKQEIGRMAVRRIRDKLNDTEKTHLKIQVCTEFIERESVRSLV
ncbi:MAG: LacI family DNA-binding transcriptional regulator [Blautia sp.]|nr:LacI family DNA-binding transcriptional regulator [Blautia sp.]